MTYLFAPLRPADAATIAGWHYPGRYALYDQALWRLQLAATAQPLFARLGTAAYSVATDAAPRDLIGLFTFTQRGQDCEIGLALRPDLAGHGQGRAFVEAGMQFARTRFAPATFSLLVAAFNQRAITVYERAGFQKVRRRLRFTHHGPVMHWEMRRPA